MSDVWESHPSLLGKETFTTTDVSLIFGCRPGAICRAIDNGDIEATRNTPTSARLVTRAALIKALQDEGVEIPEK